MQEHRNILSIQPIVLNGAKITPINDVSLIQIFYPRPIKHTNLL
jgi:hypothetical protein